MRLLPAWADWVLYILEAVRVTAFETQERVIKILEAIESTKNQVQVKAPKIYSRDLIDIIFRHPYCKARFLEDAGLAKRQTAALYLQTLESLNLLESAKVGTAKYWMMKPSVIMIIVLNGAGNFRSAS